MRFAMSLAVAALCLASVADAQDARTSSAPLMPIEQVQELPWGTPVYGFSTLDPTGPHKFTGRLLGVLHNSPLIGHDWIVVELQGQLFDGSGVIAGQSGSPVFVEVDGVPYKIGTVSYGRMLARNPIASLTPINEVIASEHVRRGSPPGVAAERIKGLLADIVPADSAMVASISSGVSTSGVVGPITPGTVLGVQLVWGDFDVTSFGTVSHIDGDKIFLFGHPYLRLGAVEYRLVPAHVFGVEKGFDRSSIIAAPIDGAAPVGVITQDRETGIAGVLGKEPTKATPVKFTVVTDLETREFNFWTITHPILTPIIIKETAEEAMFMPIRDKGDVTVFMSGAVEVEGGTVPLDGSFTSTEVAANSIQQKLDQALGNNFVPIKAKKISLQLRLYEDLRVFSVRLLSFERGPLVRPGEDIQVKYVLSRLRGEPKIGTITIPIPKDARPGNGGRILISDKKVPLDALKEPATPQSFQEITAKAASAKPDELYVHVFAASGKVIFTAPVPVGDLVAIGTQSLGFTVAK